MKAFFKKIIIFVSISASGCGGMYKSQLNFNPAEPLRIAVLPFNRIDDKGMAVNDKGDLLIDQVISTKSEDSPADFVQSQVQSELSNLSLDIIPPGVVEGELLHHGFDKVGSKPVTLDVPKLLTATPNELCNKILSCDAVLYGSVTKWDRSYYGIQTVNTVGINLKLVSAKDQKVLFESLAENTESRGLTKGPTGFSDLVLEPIKGLDAEIIEDLSRELVKKMLKPLAVSSKPEYLETAPPAILASAHDALNGKISKNDKLTVVAMGSPGQSATFAIGTAVDSVPMFERSAGHYIGEFLPLQTDNFKDQEVNVTLKDQFGRTITQRLAKIPVSIQ